MLMYLLNRLLLHAGPQRLPDGGPLYAETNMERMIVEPWNAGSAVLFIGIALYWMWHLRDSYREYPFLAACAPILLAGGLGGTLYHGLRSHQLFLYLDIGPIFLLSLGAGVFLWYQVTSNWPHVLWGFPAFFAFRWIGSDYLAAHTLINTGYVILAVFLLAPVAWILNRTGFENGLRVVGAVISFAAALYFRLIDLEAPLAMGTHWLWHGFGALACTLMLSYLYRLRRDHPRGFR